MMRGVPPGSAPGGSRTPNLLIRSYSAREAVLDRGVPTAEPSETGIVICSVQAKTEPLLGAHPSPRAARALISA
jgi:hypothetical protein